MQFNLSQWSLTHRSFTIYCMIALVLAGTLSYLRLGRNEDPAFTFRTMVVFAGWPGADLNETLKQVTERLERTLQETPSLDHVESYTKAGRTTIFVTLKGETPPSKSSGYLVPRPQKRRRYAPHLAFRRCRPGLQR